MRSLFGSVVLLTLIASLSGCGAHYVTPGAGANVARLDQLAPQQIAAELAREPAAPFPARLAVVRVQAPGYRSHQQESYGRGAFTVVTTRDVEEDSDFAALGALPQIAGLAPLSQILITPDLKNDEDLRQAAAKLHTDLLLVYTFNTTFRIQDNDVGPLGLVTLGFLPNQEAKVTSTASAALYDVRSGYVYGVAESTAQESTSASIWRTETAIDLSRKKAERAAFEGLLDEFGKTWDGVVGQYGGQAG